MLTWKIITIITLNIAHEGATIILFPEEESQVVQVTNQVTMK